MFRLLFSIKKLFISALSEGPAENCRQLLMQWAEGYSDREIAEAMAYKTADVVKTSRLRCLDKLRQSYKST